MHNYKLMKEDNTTLLFNTCFVDDEDIAYAYKHKFNVIYTDTRCTDTFALIKKFLDLGYTMEVIEKKQVALGNIELDPILYAKFIYHDNNQCELCGESIYKNTDKEKEIIIEILNYLICIARIVSYPTVKKYYNFDFDGSIIDLFTIIKNKFMNNTVNVEHILNNKLYKQIVSELNKLEGKEHE